MFFITLESLQLHMIIFIFSLRNTINIKLTFVANDTVRINQTIILRLLHKCLIWVTLSFLLNKVLNLWLSEHVRGYSSVVEQSTADR